MGSYGSQLNNIHTFHTMPTPGSLTLVHLIYFQNSIVSYYIPPHPNTQRLFVVFDRAPRGAQLVPSQCVSEAGLVHLILLFRFPGYLLASQATSYNSQPVRGMALTAAQSSGYESCVTYLPITFRCYGTKARGRCADYRVVLPPDGTASF